MSIKRKLIVFVSLILIFLLVSCGNNDQTSLKIKNGTKIENEDSSYSYLLSVPSDMDTINLDEYVRIYADSKYIIYTDESYDNEYEGDYTKYPLNTGENILYITVKESGLFGGKDNYIVKIYRKALITIDFDSDGGTLCQSISCDVGDIVTPPTPSKSGYTFDSWDFDFSKPITSSFTAHAVWKPIISSVAYMAPGSDIDGEYDSFSYDSYYVLSTPVKNGYLFQEWRIYETNTQVPQRGTWKFEGNVLLEATFSIEKYFITYVVNANILDFDTLNMYTIEDEYTLPIPARTDGVGFVGWYTDSAYKNNITKIEKGTYGNLVLYAKWDEETVPIEDTVYHVKINETGLSKTIDIRYGEHYTLPTLEKDHYTFLSWSYNDTIIPVSGTWMLRGDITITPVYEPIKYSVEFILDSYTTNTNDIAYYTIESADYILKNPTRKTNTFIGWYTNSSLDEKYKIEKITPSMAKNLVLYPKFDIKTYKLTYDSNGGTMLQNEYYYEVGDSFSLLTPEYPGYTFGSWYEGDNVFSNQSGVWEYDRDIVLKAKWTPTLYLITYNLDGLDENSLGLKRYYTIEDEFTLPTISKEGYFFEGWSEGEDANYYSNLKVNKGTIGNIQFTAHFSQFLYSFREDNTAIVIDYSFIPHKRDMTIPRYVSHNGVTYTVDTLGSSLFSGLADVIDDDTELDDCIIVIPLTLKKIEAYAFYDCEDVMIYVDDNKVQINTEQLNAFADALDISSEGNDQVLDVIKGLRHAIGWSYYFK